MSFFFFFFSSRRRHTRFDCDWSSDVCSSDLLDTAIQPLAPKMVEWRRDIHQHPELSGQEERTADRKSTRLNSSHSQISYAVFCLKKKKKIRRERREVHMTECSTSRRTIPTLY